MGAMNRTHIALTRYARRLRVCALGGHIRRHSPAFHLAGAGHSRAIIGGRVPPSRKAMLHDGGLRLLFLLFRSHLRAASVTFSLSPP
jgi:hypothetical protein